MNTFVNVPLPSHLPVQIFPLLSFLSIYFGPSHAPTLSQLNSHAKKWAKKLAQDEKMSHRPDNNFGENVYCVSSTAKNFKIKGQEVVDRWYSEVNDHVFGEEPKGSLLKSGHFSQMVWKDTREIGIGKARSAAGTKIFVVANFDPQGNWIGQFATHVPPVGGFAKTSATDKKAPLSMLKDRIRKTSTSSESSSDEEDFAKDCLKAHNEYRKKHGVQLLKLNEDMCKYAQEWAKTIAKKNTLQHRQPNKYGENIYWYGSNDSNYKMKGREPVDSWYSEIKDFVFGREPDDLRSGHFSQVVWQDSTELGIGMARAASGGIYVVANYNPPGNYVGSFSTNVPRPGASSKATPAEKPSPAKKAVKASSSSSSSDSDDEDFQKACLKAHNNYRRKHGVPPLKLNKN
ncbi:putative CRISP, partial [Halocaridina rubra]